MSQDFDEQWQRLTETMKAELQTGFKKMEAGLDEQLQRLRLQLEQEWMKPNQSTTIAQPQGKQPSISKPDLPKSQINRVNITESTDIANRLHSAAIHLLRRVRQSDALTGISPARLSALSVVGFGGPCTISDLAAAEQVSLPSISRIVAALEQDGMVKREADERDGRLVRIAATEKGIRVLQEGRALRTAQLNNLLQQMNTTELEATAQAVVALERLLGGPH